MKEFGIGIDIGGTTVKLGIFKTTGEIVEKWEIKTRKEEEGKFVMPDIANSICEVTKKLNISLDNVEGIGLGVPGPVLEGGVVNRCVNLGWGVLNIEEKLSHLLNGIKVKAANDANVAALGEMWKGGGQGFKNVVFVTLGTGVGGGIIINEKVINGAFGAGGEIGHIQISASETESCGCGKKGCLEQYASATGIVRQCEKLLENSEYNSKLKDIQPLTAKAIFDAAKDGDKVAIEAVEFLGETLGTALSHIACVIDPEVFVIGGGVSKAGDMLIETVKKHYIKTAFHASRGADFRLATLGNDAGIYGAVRLVL